MALLWLLWQILLVLGLGGRLRELGQRAKGRRQAPWGDGEGAVQKLQDAPVGAALPLRASRCALVQIELRPAGLRALPPAVVGGRLPERRVERDEAVVHRHGGVAPPETETETADGRTNEGWFNWGIWGNDFFFRATGRSSAFSLRRRELTSL